MTKNINEKSNLEALVKRTDDDRITAMLSDDITKLEKVYLSQLVPKFMKYLESNYGKGKIKCTKPLISPISNTILALYQLLVDGKNIGNLRVIYVSKEKDRQDNRKIEQYEKMYVGRLTPNSESTIITWSKDKGRLDDYIDIPFP